MWGKIRLQSFDMRYSWLHNTARRHVQTPIRQWSAGNVYQLKGKHCPIAVITVSVFEYFWPKLSKSVQYDLWLFQLFLAFFNSLYQELSGYVSQISLVLHIYPQEVQEHRLFCSFAWKIRFLLLAHVGKKVKNFTGAHMCNQTQLIINNLSPTNMPIIKNQAFIHVYQGSL